MPEALEILLRRHWGHESFRPLQREAVECVLQGRDCLLVLPTGGGKSLCYQLPALASGRLTLVISPLIALMDDQVANARENGLHAVALHSAQLGNDKLRALAALDEPNLHLVYVSPERLCSGEGGLLERLAPRLGLIAIDEAHCVSHWGHDFRPEYRQLSQVFAMLAQVPRLALTATATPRVQDDMHQLLGLRRPLALVGAIDRPNLIFRCLYRAKPVEQILAVAARHPGEGGIVYATTRNKVEELAAKLREEGLHCAGYHAGMPTDRRRAVQEAFSSEQLDVVVATVAFGMGIDRSNVRWVVHANLPQSVEHYQQESGRAGRDGLPADCVLLASSADLETWRYLFSRPGEDGHLAPEHVRQVREEQLRAMARYATAPVCRHRLLSAHFGQELNLALDGCGACDVCLGETAALPETEAETCARMVLSAVWRCKNRRGVGHVVNLLLGKADEKIRREGHDQIPTFGILRERDEATVRTWIDQLSVQDFLCTVRLESGATLLALTPQGLALCKHGGQVRLGLPLGRRARTAKVEAAGWTGVDRLCFEALRSLRKHVAEDIGKPPYVVASDAVLRDLARLKPVSDAQLASIKGIGAHKRARYGAAFLAVIAGGSPADAAALVPLDLDAHSV